MVRDTPYTRIYIYVYTHKGWDRWRKRTRALRNTRLAFCRAASAFIKESLAPSLSSGILLSSTSFSSCPSSPSFFLLVLFLLLFLFFLFVHVLLSSSERTNERILAHRFFVLSSRYSPSSLASFHLYNFPCYSLSLSPFLLSHVENRNSVSASSSGIFVHQDVAEGQSRVLVGECFNRRNTYIHSLFFSHYLCLSISLRLENVMTF